MWVSKVESSPATHDMSTDIVDPPRFQLGVLALKKSAESSTDCAGMKNAALQAKRYPDIQPSVFSLSASTVYAAALRMVKSMDWKLGSNDPVTGIIEATSTSSWYVFKYDAAISIQALGNSLLLDTRSESREGDSDAGKNTQLIRAYGAVLYKQFGLQPPMKH